MVASIDAFLWEQASNGDEADQNFGAFSSSLLYIWKL